MTTLPHYPRLYRRLASLSSSAPLVVLHAWPGSGKRGFASWLEQRGEAHALSRAEALAGGPENPGDARWWIVEELDAKALRSLLDHLPPSRTLLTLRARVDLPGDLAAALLGPEAWLLTRAEARRLASPRTGGDESSGDRRLESAWERTGGWYRPLVALVEGGGERELRQFVESQLLGSLPSAEARVVERLRRGDEIAGRDRPALERLESQWRLVRLRDGVPELPPALQPVSARGESAGADTEEPAFEIKLLGEPGLWRREGEERVELHWPIRRALLLLAFLASRPGLAAGRTEVIEALWPEADEETIQRNLHPTVSLLRRTLRIPGHRAPVLLSKGIYRLDPEVDWRIDLVEFERAALTGRPPDGTRDPASVDPGPWEEAWHLYAGPFLPEWEEAWIAERREELERLYLEVLRGLGEIYLARGRLTDAEDAFRSALLVDPLQESVHLSIMELYARRGRRDLVRRQYERACELLRRELGVEPMPATVAEYHRLMS